MRNLTGKLPAVAPIAAQDITFYNNRTYRNNSLMQPATAIFALVVGIVATVAIPLASYGTSAGSIVDLKIAARFYIKVAKDFNTGRCKFYDEKEFAHLVSLYGSIRHLQILGRKAL
jgi:hypothetical protein